MRLNASLIIMTLINETMAIYKTRNAGTGNGMRGMRGMFTRIPGNLLEDSGNVIILTFPRMFQKIPGDVRRDSGEC